MRQVRRHTHRIVLEQSLWVNYAANPTTRPIPPGVIPSTIADTRTVRTASVNSSVSGIVAIHKLAALFIVVTAASVSPVSA